MTTKLTQHTTAYPSESTPILDTAISLGNKPRTPTHNIFQPIGHISLDSAYTDLRLANAEEGIYCISTFYVSNALQSSGLGRAAMDIVKRMAVEEPLNARSLTLHTAKNEYEGRKEKWKAMGVGSPKVSNQDWYTRRGYEVFDVRDKYYWSKDPTGKSWPITAVFMRKRIV